MKPERRTAGFVLVNALVLVAALSAVAIAILTERQAATGRIALTLGAGRTDLVAEAGLTFAADLLRGDMQGDDVDHMSEAWSLSGFPAEVGEGLAIVSVSDLAGRFNLNLLRGDDPDTGVAVLARYFANLEIAPDTARLIAASMTAREDIRDVEDPLRFATGDMVHVGDLVSLLGPDLARDIAPHVAFLPELQKINVNTAPPELLSALVDADRDISNELAALRDRSPFADIGAFRSALEQLSGPGAKFAEALATTGSRWFEVEVRARVSDTEEQVTTILARDDRTGDVRTFTKTRMRPKPE
jgi:general secretion pathway protein K